MTAGGPPGAMPSQVGLGQLRWLIDGVAAGRLPLDEFILDFRRVHEAVERKGRPQYRSKEEARLIWDVLWALEFYSPDPSEESNPTEWNDAVAVLAEVQRVSRHLKGL